MPGQISVAINNAGSLFQCKLMLPNIMIDPALLGKLSISEFDPGVLRYDGAQKRVLAVDDDSTHLMIIEALLVPIGFQLTSLQSPLEAQRLLKKTPVDIVLLDIDMPGMNGWTLARWIRDQPDLKRLPVIMISGHALEARREGAGDRHNLADAFFVKPYSLNDFLAKLSSLLGIEYAQRRASTPPSTTLQAPQHRSDDASGADLHLMALREAIEIGHIAGIHNVIEQIRQAGHLPPEDLNRLNTLLERLDLDAMIRMLSPETALPDARK